MMKWLSAQNPIRLGATIASAVLFVIFLVLVLRGDDASRYIAVAILLVFAVLATRLDDLVDLNVSLTGGVAAKLEKQLREAQATVKQLQDFAEVFAARSVQQIAADNRMSGLSPRQKREAIEQLVQGLRKIQLPDDRIADVLSRQYPYDDYDYFSWTTRPIYLEYMTEVEPFQDEIFKHGASKGVGHNPSAEQTEAFLKKNNWYSGEIAERMKDWRYWEVHRSHRRQDEWEARLGYEDGSRPALRLAEALKPLEGIAP
ncbi:hypothetical protein AB9F43_10125 [Rhizobium leguminosarum]|uniref:hypothetical protein n=1 Tax=Rhizobium leguminosarum TaxID=384 RepID=UPI003F99236D